MKLAVLTVFKNEADVLPAWLKHYEDQVDYFLFRDNESTDDGFKIAKNHPKTVFIESVEGPFQTNMWDGLIEEAQKYLSHEDWFTIAAPDLFPFYNMKQEINRVGLCNCIETHYPIFFFTDEMYKKYEVDRKYRQQIDKFDIENYKYFKVTGRKMPLLIKNVFNNGRVRYIKPKQEPPHIPGKSIFKSNQCIGHYRFRSPTQMQERLQIRKQVNPNRIRGKSFKHYPTWNWNDYLIPEKQLHRFDGVFHTKQLKQESLDSLLKGTCQ